MKKITQIIASAAPLQGQNIDTDQIIPARFLKKDRLLAGGYGPYLFHDLRLDADGKPQASFILNQPGYAKAEILVAEHNFGCGSSREGAVYALADYGFKAVIASSFGDIFFNNCLKNGLLPIQLDENVITALMAQLNQASAGNTIEIDLEQQSVRWNSADGASAVVQHFSIDAFWRECLLKGVDEVELTLSYLHEIETFEAHYLTQNPWVGTATFQNIKQGS